MPANEQPPGAGTPTAPSESGELEALRHEVARLESALARQTEAAAAACVRVEQSESELGRYVSEMDEARDRVERQAASLVAQAEALEREKAQLEVVLRGSQDGYWDWDARTHVMCFSPRLAEMLGYDDSSTLGRSVEQWLPLIHPDDHDHAVNAWNQYVQGARPRLDCEGRIRHTSGRWLWVLARGQIVERQTDGTPRRVAGIISDITERKGLEGELRQSQKLEAVGQLAAGIAHELNTPIQYVGSNVQFLRETWTPVGALLDWCSPVRSALVALSADPAVVAGFDAAIALADLDYVREQFPRALEESLDGVARVSTIVRAVKEFCHPGGREKAAVDVNRAIESTITLARNNWKYVADLETALDPELPPVECLVDQLNQVVLNLLVNASHAVEEKNHGNSNAKGTITIGTRRRGDVAEIWVQDTGIGIPDAVRARVFEPFFTTKPVGKGTGQGLSLAHAVVVRQHGGDIGFESEVGVGTTFFIRLPFISKTPSTR